MKKIFLNESEKQKYFAEKEKMILESFAKTYNKIKRVDENELNEINFDRAADNYYPNPHNRDVPSDEVTSVENYGYDIDNYPQYSFEAQSATGFISSLDILRELAGWEFTSGCESKNPSIIKICDELYDKMENYYNSFPVVKTHYGNTVSDEDWEKYNEYNKEVYSHDIVTKIIETELEISLAEAIEKLLSEGLIDNIEEPERGFREPD